MWELEVSLTFQAYMKQDFFIEVKMCLCVLDRLVFCGGGDCANRDTTNIRAVQES